MGMRFKALIACAVVGGAYMATASVAQVSEEARFTYNGQDIVITQTPRVNGAAVAALYRLPDDCTGICIAPQIAADGVATVSERDVLDFIVNSVTTGDGLLIDSRLPVDRAVAYLPASTNVPHALIKPDNPLLEDILLAMGARSAGGALSFDTALPLMVFDDGPTTMDAPEFINAIITAGYPAEKITYYRGGMQVWTAMGLKTEGTSS